MRNIVNFNRKWAFAKAITAAPAEIPATWNWVNLPHTWNAIDGQDGGNDYYRGTCCYAKTFEKIDLPEAGRYYLQLEGANSSADVYLNGQHLGHHDGGYSIWRVELTGALAQENLLAVLVDNAPNDRVYPQMADFTFYGGLYRNVSVICVADTHFDLEDHGGPGLRVTPVVEGDLARVRTEVGLTNMTEAHTLRYILCDQAGQVLQTVTTAQPQMECVIENVHLWHGRRDPYLYTMEVQLLLGDEVVDTIRTRFGCRTFRIDAAEGFFLNGEKYPLRGVSRHQDRWELGNALLPEHHEQDIGFIMELGCTTIRLAHYQHDQHFYDLCDEKGLVIWAEIPYISQHMPTGRENTISQMTELITQNYNHPSIVVWGLSNEITMKGDADPDLLENHRLLNDLCHRMDPTRLTTLAAVSPCPINSEYLRIPDVVSYNHYFGWYGGDTSMNGPWFDNFRKVNPDIPIGISEYGCEALNWHTSDPRQGDYTEEYQAYYHEELIKAIHARPYLWATHVWNMFDFGADARAEGGENGQNHKGLMTFDRKYKKDSFYAYKAWLNPEPMVHLCGKRYIDRVEDVTKVTVYSNCPCVEMFANGVSLGVQEKGELPFFYFQVPNTGITHLEAVAGDLRDESVIRKVDVFNPDYRLREKGAVLNWFDITEPEGYLSLNSTCKQIMATVRGKMLLMGLLAKIAPKLGGKAGGEGGPDLGGMSGMADMMGGFTLLRMSGMMGMIGVEFTKEELLELNAKLNKIKVKE